MLEAEVDLAKEAGLALMGTFGSANVIAKKGDHSNVVTAADTRAEKIIVDGIRRQFPNHSIIAEEMGCDLRDAGFTWIIDPLDGTSNYAAGIPWFGVLIGILKDKSPIAGPMYLPVSGDMYTAEIGKGAFKNGQPISVAHDQALSDSLWAYGMDSGTTEEETQRNVIVLSQLLKRVRNIRATNSLIDPAYTAEGHLGGMLNQSTKVWDIVAPMLIVQEASGYYTDVQGQPLRLDTSQSACETEYAVLAGAPQLHREVVTLVSAFR